MKDFNPCEAINTAFTQQVRMERLLNLLQSNQAACNDLDCITNPESSVNTSQAEDASPAYLTIMFVTMIAALMLYLSRPNSLRSSRIQAKPHNDSNHHDRNDDDDNNNNDYVPPVL